MVLTSRELAYFNDKGTILAPVSVIDQRQVKLQDFIRFLVDYHFPDSDSILDPTPGESNYMFGDRLKPRGDCTWDYYGRRYVAYSLEPTRWSMDCNGGYRRIDVLEKWPMGDAEYDIVVYDPPYIPWGRHDERKKDYGYHLEHGMEYIRMLYGAHVAGEIARVARHGSIVKGADFYYPPASYNFYSFLADIIDLGSFRRHFKVAGLYIYRFVAWNIGLYRARIARSRLRPVFVHTIYLILYRHDYEPEVWHKRGDARDKLYWLDGAKLRITEYLG